MFFQRFSQDFRQPLPARENISIETDFRLHDSVNLFTEITENEWVSGSEIAERASHTIAQAHDPLRGDVKHLLRIGGPARTGVS